MTLRDPFDVFEPIYRSERWGKGKGSGTGSAPAYSAKWLEYLAKTIPAGSHVLDIGCGDHQLYAGYAPVRTWEYAGVDASTTALTLARKNSPWARLEHCALTYDTVDWLIDEFHRHPDYILLKDVIQHWTCDEIDQFLGGLCSSAKSATIIIANNWRYFRTPGRPVMPRVLDRYSWAPVPADHPTLVRLGFRSVDYYPAGKFKLIMQRDPV